MNTKTLEITSVHFDIIVVFCKENEIPCDYTEEKIKQRFLKGVGCMTIVTESNSTRKLVLNLLKQEPIQMPNADMIVDCGLLKIEQPIYLTSSIGLTSKEKFEVPPNTYAARLSCYNLDKVNYCTEKGEDYYQLDLWIAKEWPEKIMKEWKKKTKDM